MTPAPIPARRNVASLLILTLALGLIALVALALACGPSAPAEQDNTPEEATPTPAPTATSPATVPDADPSPTWVPLMGIAIQGRYDRQKAAQEPSISGQSEDLPARKVLVSIETIHVDEVLAYLKGQGITPPATVNGRPVSEIPGDIIVEIPESLLPQLARQRVGTISTANPYHPVLEHSAHRYLAEYQAGLIPLERGGFLSMHVKVKEGASFDDLKGFLESGGAVVGETYGNTRDVYVPMSLLESLAAREEPARVEFIGGPYPLEGLENLRRRYSPNAPASSATEHSPSSESASGSSGGAAVIISQQQAGVSPAVTAHSAKAWHDANPAVAGAGVRIGIIDVGFEGWDEAQRAGHLPSVTARQNCEKYLITLAVIALGCKAAVLPNHGAAVAEALYDIAPGAEFYITVPEDKEDFVDAVKWLRGMNVGGIHAPPRIEKVDIIVMARAWDYDGPGDGSIGASQPEDSAIAAVKEAIDDGILWVNSAGNEKARTWFSNKPNNGFGKTFIPNMTDYYVRFDTVGAGIVSNPRPAGAAPPADCNRVNLPNESWIYYFNLRWANNRWGVSGINLDLELYDASGVLRASSHSNGSYPLESITVNTFGSTVNWLVPGNRVPTGNYCLKIKHKVGPLPPAQDPVQPGWIQLQAFPAPIPNLYYSTTGHSIVNPAELNSDGMLAVGAAHVDNANPVAIPAAIWGDSSRGPLPVGSTVKPDIVGVDNVSSSVLGRVFLGTSQAAPHVAGLAALVIQKHKESGTSYDPDTIAGYIKTHADDQGARGVASAWGAGFALLPCPSQHLSVPSGRAADSYYVTGSWTANDCKSYSLPNNYADYYTFVLTKTTKVRIDLQSTGATAIDTYLQLINGISPQEGVNLATANRASAGQIDSIAKTLSSGTYTIGVTTNNANVTGDYKVRVVAETSCPTDLAGVSGAAECPAPRIDASLSPDPSSVSFKADGRWHRFTVNANVPVTVIANPGETTRSTEITASSVAGYHCPAEPHDTRARSNGEYIYLAGCVAGTGTVEIRQASNSALLRTYTFTIARDTRPPTPTPSPTPTPRPQPGITGLNLSCYPAAQLAGWNHAPSSYYGSASRRYNYAFAWTQGGSFKSRSGDTAGPSVANRASADTATRVGFAVAAIYRDANGNYVYRTVYRSASCTVPAGAPGADVPADQEYAPGPVDPMMAGCPTPGDPRIERLTAANATVSWEAVTPAMMYAYTLTVNGAPAAGSTSFTTGTTATLGIEGFGDAGDDMGFEITAICMGGHSASAYAPSQAVPAPGDDPPSDLAAPTNVAAAGGDGTVSVTWTDGRGAVYHLVGLFTPDLKRRVAADKAVGSSHTFTGVAAGEYVAMVAAVGSDSKYKYTVSDPVTVR